MIWDEKTILMVDPLVVASEQGTSLVREDATVHAGNPVLRFDQAGVAPGALGPVTATDLQLRAVVKEGGVYRAWYSLWGIKSAGEKFDGLHYDAVTCYAESTDGVMFTPKHGADGKSAVDFGITGPDVRTAGFLHDPVDKEYPYKVVYQRKARGSELNPAVRAKFPHAVGRDYSVTWGIGRSRDGLKFEPPAHEHNLIDEAMENPKLHRALDGGLVIADQMVTPVMEGQGRDVAGWITYDLVSAHRIPGWVLSFPWHMTRVPATFPIGTLDGFKWMQPHIGLACARKGPTVIALHGYLYGAPGIETYAQVSEVGLAVSHTGLGFNEVWPFRAFIPRGRKGEWDHGMVCQTSIVDDGGETRFYYTGNQLGNLGGNYQAGMASIPRDRYGYRCIKGHRDVTRRDRAAVFTLKPLVMPEPAEVTLNVSHVGAGRRVVVSLSDGAGNALEGFEESEPVVTQGFCVPVKWKGDVSGLAGKQVVMKVRMESAGCGFVYEDSPRVYAMGLGSGNAQ